MSARAHHKHPAPATSNPASAPTAIHAHRHPRAHRHESTATAAAAATPPPTRLHSTTCTQHLTHARPLTRSEWAYHVSSSPNGNGLTLGIGGRFTGNLSVQTRECTAASLEFADTLCEGTPGTGYTTKVKSRPPPPSPPRARHKRAPPPQNHLQTLYA